MTRSRSGSFYCPVEPSWAPLSIAQKAAISTAPPARSPPTTCATTPSSSPLNSQVLGGRQRREGRSVVEPLPSPSVEMIASSGITSSRHHHQRSSATSSLPSITNSLRNVVPFQHKERSAMMMIGSGASCALPDAAKAAAGLAAGRHAYSPLRPSPLRRQINTPKPLCPSALWTSQRELLPLYYATTTTSSSCSSPLPSRSSSRGGLRRTVLKNTFLAGPMAEKAKMYGLRVAWCVFGDAKEEMARDIFGPVPPESPIVLPLVEQVRHVEEEGLDHVFVEHDETVDSDESSSSESEYSEEEEEDGDTASEESDDLELDDDDQIEREVYAIFREHSFVLDKLPEVVPAAVAGGDELWEVVTLHV